MILSNQQLEARQEMIHTNWEEDYLETIADLRVQLGHKDSWYLSKMCMPCRALVVSEIHAIEYPDGTTRTIDDAQR